MFHLDNTSAVPEMPEPKDPQSNTARWFGESAQQGGISWPGADWFNIVQAELLNILQLDGIDPDKATHDQAAKAIKGVVNNLKNSFTASDGLRLIGSINGVSNLVNIEATDGDRVQLFDVIGRTYVRAPTGFGVLRYDAHVPKSKHDGFVHFSPSVPFFNISDYIDGIGETDPDGYGVFVRELEGNGVRLSHCGIYELSDSIADIALATKACKRLFELCTHGFSAIFDVELYVLNIEVEDVNYRISARAEKKLILGGDGRILKFHNDNKLRAGHVTLDNFEFNGNGKKSTQDGGILQSNFIANLTINNATLYNYVSNGFQANGIATTGTNCNTFINGGDFSQCGSQIIYPQTSNAFINNANFHDSQGHAVALVNTENLYWTGGSVTGCDYAILTYSTTSYRSSLRRLHISGVSMRGNNKAFEIARRYESSEVSQGEADIVLTDIDATGCVLPSTIGNLSTDNVDGYSIREVHLNNVFTDSYIQCHCVAGLYVSGGRNRGLRVRGKFERINFKPAKINGDSSSATTNTAIYIYASGTGKGLSLDAGAYQGLNSFMYAESGFSPNGEISINDSPVMPSGMQYRVNSVLYGAVSCNSGNRLRDMSRKSWGIGKMFWDETLGKFVTWNGTNIIDMTGNIAN